MPIQLELGLDAVDYPIDVPLKRTATRLIGPIYPSPTQSGIIDGMMCPKE